MEEIKSLLSKRPYTQEVVGNEVRDCDIERLDDSDYERSMGEAEYQETPADLLDVLPSNVFSSTSRSANTTLSQSKSFHFKSCGSDSTA